MKRLNLTLKGRMWKMFTVNGTYEWVSILPKLVSDYNSYHRTIGMKPKDVRLKHVKGSRMRGKTKKSNPKFKVNDKVRISKYKRVFQKGYIPNWTNEVFTIVLVKRTDPITYVLQDSKGEILKGGFYEQDLSKSKTGDVYLIKKYCVKKGIRYWFDGRVLIIHLTRGLIKNTFCNQKRTLWDNNILLVTTLKFVGKSCTGSHTIHSDVEIIHYICVCTKQKCY